MNRLGRTRSDRRIFVPYNSAVLLVSRMLRAWGEVGVLLAVIGRAAADEGTMTEEPHCSFIDLMAMVGAVSTPPPPPPPPPSPRLPVAFGCWSAVCVHVPV
eukprot:COSAG02_NODE_4976_length_4763_cov_57.094554_2_plen_101_part_00